MKYAVLGGGALGLMAAYRLAQANQTVIVFEQENIAGGLAGGFTATGFCAEWQAHTPSKAPTSSAVRTWRSTNRMFLNKMRGLSVELMFAEFYQKS